MSVRLTRMFVLLITLFIAAPAVAQDANGAGTRSAIPSTRNKPGLRSEGKKEEKKDKKEAAQQDDGKEAAGEGEGGEQGTVKANGAGTRSAIPSTRNKPGLRSEGKKEEKEDKEEAAQEGDSAKAAE